MKNLIVLVADKNMESLLEGLLLRLPLTENIKKFDLDISVHPKRDAGVLNHCHEFLRPFINKYEFALVVLDHEGCGRESVKREEIETEIEKKLSLNGWNNRSSAIVISPELEQWVWVNEIQIRKAVSWENNLNIYDWLQQNNLIISGSFKPLKPKETFEKILYTSKMPRSSSIYSYISTQASYKQCADPAFLKLLNCLKGWFK